MLEESLAHKQRVAILFEHLTADNPKTWDQQVELCRLQQWIWTVDMKKKWDKHWSLHMIACYVFSYIFTIVCVRSPAWRDSSCNNLVLRSIWFNSPPLIVGKHSPLSLIHQWRNAIWKDVWHCRPVLHCSTFVPVIPPVIKLWAINTVWIIFAWHWGSCITPYLNISEWYIFVVSIFLDSYKEIFIVWILATSCVVVTSTIVCPVSDNDK